LLPRCSLPITAAGVVTLVVTDLGLFAPMGEGFALRDLAPDVTLEEVRAATACPIIA
jgi:acyl CoA:acetate/3-ketoacid CoA transferase beta subunit